jgi:hypothetical protein
MEALWAISTAKYKMKVLDWKNHAKTTQTDGEDKPSHIWDTLLSTKLLPQTTNNCPSWLSKNEYEISLKIN